MFGSRDYGYNASSFTILIMNKTYKWIDAIFILDLLDYSCTLWSLEWFIVITIIGYLFWLQFLNSLCHFSTDSTWNPDFLMIVSLVKLLIFIVSFIFTSTILSWSCAMILMVLPDCVPSFIADDFQFLCPHKLNGQLSVFYPCYLPVTYHFKYRFAFLPHFHNRKNQ